MNVSKRVKIRAPRHSFSSNNVDLESSWPILETAIDLIYDGKQSTLSFEELYRLVYDLVIRKYGEQLLENVKDAFTRRMKDIHDRGLFVELSSIEFLRRLNGIWNHQKLCLKMISDTMMYMDKALAWKGRQANVYVLGLDLFRDIVAKPIADKIVSSMIMEINRARKSLVDVDISTLISIVDMMQILNEGNETFYTLYFEPHLLQDVGSYYTQWRQRYADDAVLYINRVQEALNNELAVYKRITNGQSAVKCNEVMKKILISDNIEFVLRDSVHDCIKNSDTENLQLIIGFCKEPQDEQKFLDTLSNCVMNDGFAIPENQSVKKRAQLSLSWVKGLIEVKDTYENILHKANCLNGPYKKSMSDALAKVINSKPNKSIEYISTSIDGVLRTNTTLNKEMQTFLQDCIGFFALIRDKDLFELFYKQQFSKRLLQQKSSLQLEQWMISRMATAVGIDFTSKLEGMFRDINVSHGYDKKFKGSEIMGIDFQAKVLTPTFWPFKPMETLTQDVVLPLELQDLKIAYESFYLENHSGRTLKWAYHLGSVEIGFQFSKTYHDLSMSVYAATIFLLFQDYSSLTMQEIGDLTHIPEPELVRQLLSLSTIPKTRILKKLPLTKSIKLTDIFSVNYEFSVPSRKVKIVTILKSEATPSSGSTPFPATKTIADEIDENRLQAVNAAIIRIMKSERKLTDDKLHNIVSELLSSKMKVTKEFFKKSTNNLIEKEYLQRDIDDSATFHYLP
ncbi:cullin CUL3 Ecym_1442 [Eremothecium cymbalariae DBVPG|uniref:Cullin family profile domain-containing protein n=1 Tax=Eremothecium cymbalariae (strain CBS 270.75 / DBVPG 7215 / KCTC 17166 / NRRL Y-17582) TaxID=931890 RepID=G8JMF1_ERECY|nr:hypothetical protein Ecym_1442 [Eremothecium cymbalariae DBVPG\